MNKEIVASDMSQIDPMAERLFKGINSIMYINPTLIERDNISPKQKYVTIITLMLVV